MLRAWRIREEMETELELELFEKLMLELEFELESGVWGGVLEREEENDFVGEEKLVEVDVEEDVVVETTLVFSSGFNWRWFKRSVTDKL